MFEKIPLYELNDRMNRFINRMNAKNPDWEVAFIINKINIYYFTGTIQDGILVIPRDEQPVFFVRRNIERALLESEFTNIKPIQNFRDISIGSNYDFPRTVYLETEFVTIALLKRINKYFNFEEVKSLDVDVSMVRAKKSSYELDLMAKCGSIHRRVMVEHVPQLLKEGMSELELFSQLYSKLLQEGHHGVNRFGIYNSDDAAGIVCFSENSIYPSTFNGPGGSAGLSKSIPYLGNPNRKLRKGDLVFIDVGCSFEGYHTDMTMTYMFGKSLDNNFIDVHKQCVEILETISDLLRPGITPSEIYTKITSSLDKEFLENFMGYGQNTCKFLGHGIGLTVSELPIIARGFTEPIEEGMTFAIEPKKGIKHIGTVGIEHTFVVTKDGGKSLTGNCSGLIPVY